MLYLKFNARLVEVEILVLEFVKQLVYFSVALEFLQLGFRPSIILFSHKLKILFDFVSMIGVSFGVN